MKTETLEYLIMINKCGSLNKAAAQLYISQPRLSSAIQSLEKELNYPILVRNNSGVQFTPQGKEVLRFAYSVINEKNRLTQAGSSVSRAEIRLSVSGIHLCVQAFLSLIRQYMNYDNIHLEMIFQEYQPLLNSVYSNQADLGVIAYSSRQGSWIRNYVETHDMQLQKLTDLQCQVHLRKGHPLLEKGFSMEKLWDYPFVEQAERSVDTYDELAEMRIINPDKIIYVNEARLRRQIVLSTDAYSIGIQQQKKAQITEMVSIPIPNLNLEVACVTHQGVPQSRILKEYIAYMTEELQYL